MIFDSWHACLNEYPISSSDIEYRMLSVNFEWPRKKIYFVWLIYEVWSSDNFSVSLMIFHLDLIIGWKRFKNNFFRIFIFKITKLTLLKFETTPRFFLSLFDIFENWIRSVTILLIIVLFTFIYSIKNRGNDFKTNKC